MTGCCDDAPGCGPRDLRERLRVIAVEPDRLVVVADRMSGCAACAQAKGCGTRALAAMTRSDSLAIPRPAWAEVAAGDEIEVSVPGNSLLAAAGIVYLLPALAFVLAMAAGASAGLRDAETAGLALAALGLSFLPMIWIERRAKFLAALRVLAVHPAARRRP